MKRALALSLVLHAAVLAALGLLWSAPVPVSRVHLRTLTLPGQDPVSLAAVSPEAVSSALDAPFPNPVSADQAVGGSEDLVVDALTPGPAWERPSLVGYPAPIYPRQARRLGWKGVVEVDVLVDGSGRQNAVSVVKSSGYPDLDEAALGALRGASYLPGSRDGVPRPAHLTVLVRFRLE